MNLLFPENFGSRKWRLNVILSRPGYPAGPRHSDFVPVCNLYSFLQIKDHPLNIMVSFINTDIAWFDTKWNKASTYI